MRGNGSNEVDCLMIKGFIVGYYRSGTTITQKVISESNPNLYVIHEPSVPTVYDKVKQGVAYSALHGWDFLSDFLNLPIECRDEWFANAVLSSMYLNPDEAFQTFDPFHRCNRDIMIKTCQSHFVLPYLIDRYECRYVLLLRDPVEVFSSHGGPGSLSFFFEFIHNNLIKLNLIPEGSNNIEKFLNVWCYLNNLVVEHAEQTGKGIVVNFNKMVKQPHVYFRKIADFLNINYDESVGEQVNHERPRQVDSSLREDFDEYLPRYKETFPLVFKYFEVLV